MDIDSVRFLVGFVLLSWVLAYAWWVKVRVLRLRDDLFAIRDRLFDAAQSEAGFDDPAYCYARNSINCTIRLAGTLSVPTVIYMCAKADGKSVPSRPGSKSADLQQAVTAALDDRDTRVVKYLLNETLGGRFLCIVALFLFLPREIYQLVQRRSVAHCLESRLAQELSLHAA